MTRAARCADGAWYRLSRPLGGLLLRARGDALCAVDFEQAPRPRAAGGLRELDTAAPPLLREAARQFDEYLRGQRSVFELPLRAEGADFARRVWEALAGIPHGSSLSYAQLALRLGLDRAHARAVARAVGANPLLIVVPCHRVIGSDGALRGYAGGVERKRALLDLEARTLAAGRRAAQESVGLQLSPKNTPSGARL